MSSEVSTTLLRKQHSQRQSECSAVAPQSLRSYGKLFLNVLFCLIIGTVMNIQAQISPTVQIILPADTNAIPLQPTFTLKTQFPIVEESVRYVDTTTCDTCQFILPLAGEYFTAYVVPSFVADSIPDSLWFHYEIPVYCSIINDTTIEAWPHYALLPDQSYTLAVRHLQVEVPQYASANVDTVNVQPLNLQFHTDLPAYSVVNVFPSLGMAIKCNDTISVQFNRPVSVTQLSQMNMIELTARDQGNAPVPFSLVGNPNDSTLIYILPNSALQIGHHYKLNVQGSLLSGDSKDNKLSYFQLKDAQNVFISVLRINANGDSTFKYETTATQTLAYGKPTHISVPSVDDGYRFMHWKSESYFDEDKRSSLPYVPVCYVGDLLLTAVYAEIRPVSTYRIMNNPNLDIIVKIDGDVVGGPGEYEVPLGSSIFIQANDTEEHRFLKWNSSFGAWDDFHKKGFVADGMGVNVDFWPDDYRVDKFPIPSFPATLLVNVKASAPLRTLDPETNSWSLIDIGEDMDISQVFDYTPKNLVRQTIGGPFGLVATPVAFLGNVINNSCWKIDSVHIRDGGALIRREDFSSNNPPVQSWGGSETPTTPGIVITYFIAPINSFTLTSEVDVSSISDPVLNPEVGDIPSNRVRKLTIRYFYKNKKGGLTKFGAHTTKNLNLWELPCGLKVTAERVLLDQTGLKFVQWKDNTQPVEYTYPLDVVNDDAFEFTMDKNRRVGHVFGELSFFLEQFESVFWDVKLEKYDNKTEREYKARGGNVLDQLQVLPVGGRYLRSFVKLRFSKPVDPNTILPGHLVIRDVEDRLDGLGQLNYDINPGVTITVSGKVVTFEFDPNRNTGIPRLQRFEVQTTSEIRSSDGENLENPNNYLLETEFPGVRVTLKRVKTLGNWQKNTYPARYISPVPKRVTSTAAVLINPLVANKDAAGDVIPDTEVLTAPSAPLPQILPNVPSNQFYAVNLQHKEYQKNRLNSYSFLAFQAVSNVFGDPNHPLAKDFEQSSTDLFIEYVTVEFAKNALKNVLKQVGIVLGVPIIGKIVAIASIAYTLVKAIIAFFSRPRSSSVEPVLRHRTSMLLQRSNKFQLPVGSQFQNGGTHDIITDGRFEWQIDRID